MKKVLLPFLILGFITLNAQISVTSTVPNQKTIQKTITKAAYDSTYNYPGNKIYMLIGQKFFVKPKPVELQHNGYLKFINNPNKSEFAAPNIYKHRKGISSDYNALAGRYFELKNIVRTKYKKLALILQDVKLNDSIYFIYNAYNKKSFPFLIEGYFKKLEKEKKGQKFILRSLKNPVIYITPGLNVVFGEEKLWEIEKVTLDDKYFNISYVLKDSNNNEILVFKNDFEKTALTETEYNLIKKKYPDKYKMILNQKVAVGMTTEACKYALGKPKKVNRSGNLEQWIYRNLTLYFNSGKLSSIN